MVVRMKRGPRQYSVPVRKANAGNYEARLRKLLMVFKLITGEIEEALEAIERERKT